MKPFLDARVPPVRLIAVGGEHIGHEEFSTYWKGEPVLFDLGKQTLFKIMGAGKTGLLSGALSYFLGGAVAQNSERCDTKGITGNLVGEGLKLGGVWAVSPTGGIVYEHKESTWGDIVEGSGLDELKAAVSSFGSDPGTSPAE
jgi:hypothetical protein